MSGRDPLVRLRHMLRYARSANRIATTRSRQEVEADEDLTNSLILSVGMIGEAAMGVPSEVRERHPSIPWRVIVGMRHRLFHGYESLIMDLVWLAAATDVPPLIAELERILGPEEEA